MEVVGRGEKLSRRDETSKHSILGKEGHSSRAGKQKDTGTYLALLGLLPPFKVTVYTLYKEHCTVFLFFRPRELKVLNCDWIGLYLHVGASLPYKQYINL